jgi:phage repressor protein C with HTH and peptisase S24 domain/DNA-binding XRE family transcriptional regulator
MTIGERIMELRKRAGLSRRDMAVNFEIPYSTYTNFETGARTPNSFHLVAFARFFGVTVDYIVLGDAANMERLGSPLFPRTQRIGRAYEKASQREQSIVEHVLEPYMDEKDDNILHVDFKQSEYNKASAGDGFQLNDDSMIITRVRLDALPRGYERDPDRYFGVTVSGDSMEPKYHDGDILIVKDQSLDVGDIGVAVMNGEGYVKQIGSGFLHPLNPAYDDIPISEGIHFCGKVVGVLDPSAFEE